MTLDHIKFNRMLGERSISMTLVHTINNLGVILHCYIARRTGSSSGSIGIIVAECEALETTEFFIGQSSTKVKDSVIAAIDQLP